jgi:hypothetical protein
MEKLRGQQVGCRCVAVGGCGIHPNAKCVEMSTHAPRREDSEVNRMNLAEGRGAQKRMKRGYGIMLVESRPTR